MCRLKQAIFIPRTASLSRAAQMDVPSASTTLHCLANLMICLTCHCSIISSTSLSPSVSPCTPGTCHTGERNASLSSASPRAIRARACGLCPYWTPRTCRSLHRRSKSLSRSLFHSRGSSDPRPRDWQPDTPSVSCASSSASNMVMPSNSPSPTTGSPGNSNMR